MKRKPNHKLLILFLHIIFANTFMLQAQINTNLPVGAIPGAVDVTPTGAATYTIPIEVVPGTQGMQPNLSISYNSMGSMGLLGMKWNLAGLSSISRCGKMPYYNHWDGNYITSIKFNKDDRFLLDGNRLLTQNVSSYGTVGAHYTTEMVNFTTIVSNDGTLGHPDYFTAYTDDGGIIEYGNNANSKQRLGANNSNTVLSWLVSKMSDAEGNYMTFHYGKDDNTKEYWLDSIKYTGNSGMQPYAKVRFEYIENTLNSDTYFVGVYAIPQTKLLKYITVSYQNNVVRKYEFNYNLDDPDETTPHLKEVILYSENCANTLNATTFTWGEPNKLSKPGQKMLFNYPYERFITGDFNGDGTLDYIAYGLGTTRNTWKLYTGVPETDNFVFSMEGTHRPLFYYYKKQSCFFYAADVNGDGCDELIIAEMMSNSDLPSYCYRIISATTNTEIVSKGLNYISELFFGDFDGDGSTDILFVRNKNGDYLFDFLLETRFFDSISSPVSVPAPCRVRVGDFNGDGRSEIEVSTDEYLYIFKYIAPYNIFLPSLYPPVTSVFDRYSGDFNGDGITDLLTYDWTQLEGLRWQLYIGKGDGSYTSPTRITELNNAHDVLSNGRYVPRYKVLIADISGDGKDDIIQPFYFVEDFTEKSILNVVYSKGFYNNAYQYSNKKDTIMPVYKGLEYFSIVDVNRDGVLDILIQDSTPYPTFEPFAIYLYKNNRYEFIKEIKDGIGKTTKFTYNFKYVKAESVTWYDASGTRTKIKRYMLPLVNNILFSNGINQDLNTITYQYENPMFSFRKKSFLGFKKFTAIDTQENRKDVSLFEQDTYNNQYFGNRETLLPVSQLSYVNNQLISQAVTSNEIKTVNDYQFIINSSSVDVEDYLSNAKTITSNNLNADGRLVETNTITYNSVVENPKFLAHSQTNSYQYQTLTLSGNKKKTVPTQVLTTQQYGFNGVIITDTVTNEYYSASEKGRLKWQRKGNLDGCITTSYEYLNPVGVCTLKTVSAAGCTPRTEKYEYDATHRFVTKITNPLNHSANFTYDAKTGNKLTETNANDLTTTYIYDSFGQLKQINHADGTITKDTICWYSVGYFPNAIYFSKTTTTGQPELIVYYDILGREVYRLDDGNYYDTHYNNKGQVTKISYPYTKLTDPEYSKIWNNFEYDNYGRKSKEIAPYISLSYSYNNRKITITDHLRNNQTSWKDYDALGRVTQAQDPGGLITYTYSVITSNSKPRHKTQISSNGATTTIETDLWGNRLSINEPNAGIITSTYNKFNELVYQKDANKSVTTYEYDMLGRVTKKQFSDRFPTQEPDPNWSNDSTRSALPTINITYTYDNFSNNNKGKGKIHQISVDNDVDETYLYDNKGRLAQYTKTVDDTPFTFNYTYTSTGQVETLTYPDNYAIKYSYSGTGKMTEIRNPANNSLIYRVISRNKFNATTQCEYGNGVVSEYSFNDFGIITRINTGNKLFLEEREGLRGPILFTPDSTILNYRYAYDTKGLMSSRSERIINRLETFTYDNLDRLKKITAGQIGQTGIAQNFYFHNNGNITANSQLGSYSYLSSKPHAVTQIDPINENVISAAQCDVTYNLFNQPIRITETSDTLSYQLELYYGSNQLRNKMVQNRNTRYYINKYYEVEVTGIHTKITRNYHYIYGENGIVALQIKNVSQNTDSIFYIHTDHLGSYCAITNAAKQVRQRNFFDPWGNNIGTANFTLTHRGFTGHEHYPQFKIINMNGRLYDPVISRFFSPDMFVVNASFTQDFNRYSYCRNNPLHYTDPTGQKIDGYAIWSFIMFPVFLPARLLSEAFTWVDDKINGNTRYGGYFQPGYMTGQTGPGTLTPYNSVNTINYGEPGYIHHGPFVGKPTSSGWIDLYHDITMKKEYVKRIGSKKIQFLPKNVALSIKTRANAQFLSYLAGRFITGTYVGKFEGVDVYENKRLGNYKEGYYGVTIPEKGIFIGTGIYKEGKYNRDNFFMMHEFGHIMQYRRWGATAYWNIIARESFMSAAFNTDNHDNFWTETYANYLASRYFLEFNWNSPSVQKNYPIQNISDENILRLLQVGN